MKKQHFEFDHYHGDHPRHLSLQPFPRQHQGGVCEEPRAEKPVIGRLLPHCHPQGSGKGWEGLT